MHSLCVPSDEKEHRIALCSSPPLRRMVRMVEMSQGDVSIFFLSVCRGGWRKDMDDLGKNHYFLVLSGGMNVRTFAAEMIINL